MDASILLEALNVLSSTLGEDFRKLVFKENSNRVKNANLILLNGQNYLNLSKKLDTALRDGDEITMLPMITGG
jgi:molybdopterin converting factor small subunit